MFLALNVDDLNEKFQSLLVKLNELTECPVCFAVMGPNLRQCLKGHGICENCAKTLEKCPTCNASFVVRKNILLMQLLECLPKPCVFTDNGCDVIVFDEEHQTFCAFRPFSCVVKSCDWQGHVKDAVEHFKGQHSQDLSEVSSLDTDHQGNLYFNEGERSATLIEIPVICNNQFFFSYFRLSIHERKGTFSISHKCYYLPTAKPSCTYYMSLGFKKDNFEFKFTNRIAPVENLLSALIFDLDSHDCGSRLSMSKSEFKRYQNNEHQFEYSFKIFNDTE